MNSIYLTVTRLEEESQKISLEGSIDEQSNFYQFNFPIATNVVIDLEKIITINTHGIKKWIDWTKELFSRSSLSLICCPPCIVDQINIIEGFLPPHAVIESFYVPYYSNKSHYEKRVLFERGKEFTNDTLSLPDLVTSEQKEDLEIDVVEETYFSFLFKKKKSTPSSP